MNLKRGRIMQLKHSGYTFVLFNEFTYLQRKFAFNLTAHGTMGLCVVDNGGLVTDMAINSQTEVVRCMKRMRQYLYSLDRDRVISTIDASCNSEIVLKPNRKHHYDLGEFVAKLPRKHNPRYILGRELCHIFRYGRDSEGNTYSEGINRSNGNCSFEGNYFKSYRTIIARKLDNDTLIVNKRSYSSTTARHKSDVVYAFRGGLVVPMPDCTKITTLHDALDYYDNELRKLARIMANPKWVSMWRSRPRELWEYTELYATYRAICDRLGYTPIDYLGHCGITPQIVDNWRERAQNNYNSASNRSSHFGRKNRYIHTPILLADWLKNGGYTRGRHYQFVRSYSDDRIITTFGVQMPKVLIRRVWDLALRGELPSTIGPYTIHAMDLPNTATIGCHVFNTVGLYTIALACNIPWDWEIPSLEVLI